MVMMVMVTPAVWVVRIAGLAVIAVAAINGRAFTRASEAPNQCQDNADEHENL